MDRYKSSLVWIDLEMTGLDPDRDTILEIATVVTNNDLEIIAEGPNIVIHHSDEVLTLMDEWNTTQHTSSGLVKAVQQSTINLEEAEQETLAFLQNYTKKRMSPLCGNSVWQDRLFIQHHMPHLDAFLHYRIIDVSSIKEVVRRWYSGNPYEKFIKPENHRAHEDILYSIAELKHYRTHFFITT
jgi:oligoribonuclease